LSGLPSLEQLVIAALPQAIAQQEDAPLGEEEIASIDILESGDEAEDDEMMMK
jgi:hypothetical protein